MSTFSLLLLLLFLIIFGVQIFLYCVNLNKPKLSGFMTLLLILMLIAEIIIATFELPAKLIDGIVFISMGNKTIAIGCGIVIFTILAFIFIMIYPKIHWQRVMSANLIKYVVIGALIIILMAYTELFNGCYSFNSMKDYFDFKSDFSQYDNRFWPTKFIKNTDNKGQDDIITYSVYPWDVEIPDGQQFAYKVITFYSVDNNGNNYKLYYYPFTYKLYAGVTALPIEHDTDTVSASDISNGNIAN
jgi:hypothetical protein